MKQIVSGVAYIHSHNEIHRDLKPSNSRNPRCDTLTCSLVLYSRRDSVWKIADLGLVAQGTSRTLRSSTSARGTTGYRAPELLSEDKPGFNHKIDIWAIGCILYELAVGQQAFRDDMAVFRYSLGEVKVSPISNETFNNDSGATLNKSVDRMLQIDSSLRPSALTLLEDIGRFCQRGEPTNDNVQIHQEFAPNCRPNFTPDPPVSSASSTHSISSF